MTHCGVFLLVVALAFFLISKAYRAFPLAEMSSVAGMVQMRALATAMMGGICLLPGVADAGVVQ